MKDDGQVYYVIIFLIVIFWGAPDLYDALIHFLMK